MTVLLCSACERSPTPTDKVTIRYWTGFPGPDGRTMLALVKRFNAENPDVHVIMQRMEWGTYYNKVFVANLGDRGPDVFVIHADHIARFKDAGFLRPTDDVAIDPNDFDPIVWKSAEIGGQHWSIPLDIHLEGMYYNKKLFREAGIVDENGQAKPPTNREEFLEAARKLTRDFDGDGRIDQWGYVFDWLRNDVYTLMSQNGGRLFDESLTRVTVNSPENVEAVQFAADLIAKEKVAPSPQNFGGLVGFRQGKVGMVFGGIFLLHDMQKQTDLEFGAAPLPVLMKKPAAWGSSHHLCISPELDGDDLAAAKRFVKFLSDNSLDWAQAGQIPVRRSLRESDRFQHRGAFADRPDAFSAQRAFGGQVEHAVYYPSVMFINEYVEAFDTAVEKAIRGSATPQAAMDEAARRIQAVMVRYGAVPNGDAP